VAFFVIEVSFKRQITSFHVILLVYFEGERGGDNMTTRKDLIIAVLATFCLTATLFMVVPIGGLQVYDPWKDLNDDGVIDGQDFQMVKGSIPSLGEPINKTALLYSVNDTLTALLSRIDGLNASLLDLEAYFETRMDALEANCSSAIPSISTYSYSYNATSDAYNWGDMAGMSVTLTVNRTSNLMILFSTDAYCEVGPAESTCIYIQAIVNSSIASPSNVTLTPNVQVTGFAFLPSHSHYLSMGAYSYVFNMPSMTAGSYTIKIQWLVSYSNPQGTGYVGYRTLTVIALPT
jgi:hypothetical protein